MGCNEKVDKQCDDDEPGRIVKLPTFQIDRTEVTVAAFSRCVNAGRCDRHLFSSGPYCNWGREDRSRHPMNCVSWHGAAAYCAFIGKRLPSNEEWEKAARGTDGRRFPWGDSPPASCNYAVIDDPRTKETNSSTTDGCGRDSTWPVGSKPAGNSPFGAADMSGNVWEWTEDWYVHGSTDWGKARNVRGGSWATSPEVSRASNRLRFDQTTQDMDVGFRCAM